MYQLHNRLFLLYKPKTDQRTHVLISYIVYYVYEMALNKITVPYSLYKHTLPH